MSDAVTASTIDQAQVNASQFDISSLRTVLALLVQAIVNYSRPRADQTTVHTLGVICCDDWAVSAASLRPYHSRRTCYSMHHHPAARSDCQPCQPAFTISQFKIRGGNLHPHWNVSSGHYLLLKTAKLWWDKGRNINSDWSQYQKAETRRKCFICLASGYNALHDYWQESLLVMSGLSLISQNL